MLSKVIALTLASALGASAQLITFTGNAREDFQLRPGVNKFGVVQIVDGADGRHNEIQFEGSGSPQFDVGVPNILCDQPSPGVYTDCAISGWDIRQLFFSYDDETDILKIGIDCFGVCGDADGDGVASRTSAELASLGGVDLPALSGTEGLALAMDFNLDVADVLPTVNPDALIPFDYIVGVPGGQPAGVSNDTNDVNRLPCSVGYDIADPGYLNNPNCFGIYTYQNTRAVNLARRFQRRPQRNGAVWPVLNFNPTPTLAQPDYEWDILYVSELRDLVGVPFLRSRKEAWTVLLQGFFGSFEDDGIGEDFIPSQNDFIEVNFPCREVDICDVCLGDGTSCLDCAGIPNGPGVYDECNVCNGDGTNCLDCADVLFGTKVYDVCDVCGGDGLSCLDCAAVPNGPNVYDVCDVCGGDGTSCLDCANLPNGPNVYDVCDVCNGDGTSCLDCANMPNGPNVYDVCDVCGGDGQSCLDCAGTPNGAATYDDCGVCEGDGKSCRCDGALLVQSCDHPQTLIRSTCVVYNGQELWQEAWLDPYDGAREVHYWVKLTEAYYGDESSVFAEQLQRCDCPCT